MKTIRILPLLVCLAPFAGLDCGNTQTQARPAPGSDTQYGNTLSQPADTAQSAWRDANASSSTTSDNPEPVGNTDPTVRSGPGASGATTTPSGGSTSPGTSMATGAATGTNGSDEAASLDDGQIGSILHTINKGEVAEAKLAESQAQSAEVKRFARHMEHAHTDMMTKGSALLARIHVAPTKNPVAEEIKDRGDDELSNLKAQHGRDFDTNYVDAQVKGHQHALALIDQMLQVAKNDDLRTELRNARPIVAEHLDEAERLQRDLQQAAK